MAYYMLRLFADLGDHRALDHKFEDIDRLATNLGVWQYCPTICKGEGKDGYTVDLCCHCVTLDVLGNISFGLLMDFFGFTHAETVEWALAATHDPDSLADKQSYQIGRALAASPARWNAKTDFCSFFTRVMEKHGSAVAFKKECGFCEWPEHSIYKLTDFRPRARNAFKKRGFFDPSKERREWPLPVSDDDQRWRPNLKNTEIDNKDREDIRVY